MSKQRCHFSVLSVLTVSVLTLFCTGLLSVVSATDTAVIQQAETLLTQVKEAVRAGNSETAARLLAQLSQSFPDSVYAMHAQAEIGCLCVLQGDDAGAAEALGQLYKSYSAQPEVTRAIDRVAQRYLYKKQAAKALAVYNNALLAIPNHPGAVWLHGGVIKCRIAQNDFPQAKTGLEQLWSEYLSSEGFVEVADAIRLAYWIAGDITAHQDICGRILTGFPDHAIVPTVLGYEIEGCIKLKDMDAAAAKIEKLFTITDYPLFLF